MGSIDGLEGLFPYPPRKKKKLVDLRGRARDNIRAQQIYPNIFVWIRISCKVDPIPKHTLRTAVDETLVGKDPDGGDRRGFCPSGHLLGGL